MKNDWNEKEISILMLTIALFLDVHLYINIEIYCSAFPRFFEIWRSFLGLFSSVLHR